jgi:sugar lactone lactonase YvrE
MKRILVVIVLLFAIGCGVLYTISPLRPVEWHPDANVGLQKMFLKNETLNAVTVVNAGSLIGPEDIYVSDNGVVYTGLANGDVVSFPANAPSNLRVIANTGGRPLGVRLDAQNNIIVSDPVKGLLSITQDGDISVLVKAHNGSPLRLIDHHDIAENGDIYFSDASRKFGMLDYVHDFIEATATGSVYRYSFKTGETEEILANLFFANGVALGPNDEYILVAETGKSRILKHYLRGSKKGQTSEFASGLPAMPDNLSFNGTDRFWVGMVSLRDWRVEGLAAFPVIRRIIGALPVEWLQPSKAYGFVVGFDTLGNVVANFQSPDKYTTITAAYEYNDHLYLGSLSSNGVGVLPIP